MENLPWPGGLRGRACGRNRAARLYELGRRLLLRDDGGLGGDAGGSDRPLRRHAPRARDDAGQRGESAVAILRLTAVYGAGDTHNSYGPNRFLRQALKDGRIALFGKGEETRDHLYVDDAVELVLKVLLHGSTGLLNLARGRSETFRSVAEAVGRSRRPAGRDRDLARGRTRRPIAISTSPISCAPFRACASSRSMTAWQRRLPT